MHTFTIEQYEKINVPDPFPAPSRMEEAMFSSLLCVSGLSLLACLADAHHGQNDTNLREQQLARQVKEAGPSLGAALEELATFEKLEDETLRVLLHSVDTGLKDGNLDAIRTIDALAAGRAGAAPYLLERARAGSPEEFKIYIAGLGRLGVNGKEGIGYLRKRLNDAATAEGEKQIIRPVLANLGYRPKELLNAIQQECPIGMIILIRPNDWVNQAIIADWTTRLDDPKSTAEQKERLGLLLGLLGEKACAASEKLEAKFQQALKKRTPSKDTSTRSTR